MWPGIRHAFCILSVCLVMPLGGAATVWAQAPNIAAMNDETLRLYTSGHPTESLAAARDAVLAARTTGGSDAASATAFGNYAELLRQSKQYANAEVNFSEAVRIFEQAQLQSNTNYLNVLSNYAQAAYDQNHYAVAAQRSKKVVDLLSNRTDKDGATRLAFALNSTGDAYAELGMRSEAINYYQRTTRLHSQIGTSKLVSYAYSQIGYLEGAQSHFADAEMAFGEAIKELIRLSDNATAARLTLEIAKGQHLQHRYKEARKTLDEGKALLVAGERNSHLLLEFAQESLALYRDQRLFREAQAEYDQAEMLLRSDPSFDVEDRASTQITYGTLLTRMNNYSGAEAAFKSAISLLKDAGRDRSYSAATAKTDLGVVLQDSGRLEEARGPLEEALNIFNELGLRTSPNYGSVLSNLALVYMQQRRFQAAHEIYNAALEFEEAVYSKQSAQYASTLVNIADLNDTEHDWDSCAANAKKALEILQQIGEHTTSEVNALHRLGIAQLALNKVSDGVGSLEKARDLALSLGDNGKNVLAGSLQDLGLAYDRAGDLSSAEKALQFSLGLQREVYGISSPGVAATEIDFGWIYAANRQYARAAEHFREGNDIVVHRLMADWSLAGLNVAENRYRAANSDLGFVGEIQAASRIELADTDAKQERAKRLFEMAQWASISNSAYSIALQAARSASADTDLRAKIRARQDLAFELHEAQRALVGLLAASRRRENVDDELKEAQRTLDTLAGRAAELDRHLASSKPAFMALASPTAISANEVQVDLDPDEALVGFFVTPNNRGMPGETFIWVITKTEVHLFASPMDSRAVSQFVKTLRCGLDRNLWTTSPTECANLTGKTRDEGEPLPFRMDLAYALYWQLFGQIEASIVGKKLLVTSVGELATVPLGALPVSWPDADKNQFATDYSSVRWLAREHSISMLPSINALRLLRNLPARSTMARTAFVGFGNPTLKGTNDCRTPSTMISCPSYEAPRLAQAGARDRSVSNRRDFKNGATREALSENVERLCPLPETGLELSCIASALKGVTFQAERYTKQQLKDLSEKGILETYRTVEFATHGLLPDDSDAAVEPALIATPTSIDDGLLRASEIAQLKLDADWVILAACNTGSGAGGLKGLAEAFFYAGARGVLVSNWSTDSEATVLLNVALGNALKSDHPLVEAHQLAMLALIENKQNPLLSHPEYWAPFTAVGGIVPRKPR